MRLNLYIFILYIYLYTFLVTIYALTHFDVAPGAATDNPIFRSTRTRMENGCKDDYEKK